MDKIRKVWAVYFSPTGNTKKICQTAAKALAKHLDTDWDRVDYTLPEAREKIYSFGPDEVCVFASPTYAGRTPNKLLPFLQNHFLGHETPVICMAVYGNRSYDHCLKELQLELEAHGFIPIAGAGIVSEHVFSSDLGTGRPDAADFESIEAFARKAAEGIDLGKKGSVRLSIPGPEPVGPYYVPKGLDGKPTVFLKAKPVKDLDLCKECGACSRVCPMGSVQKEAPYETTGICIKCQACIKICPAKARAMADEAFLSHVAMLRANFTGRKENDFFYI